MSNKFIYGVMRFNMYKNRQHILTAKTLIDTALPFSTESTDIRAGSGNMLLGKIFHSSTLKLKFIDACFKMQYLSLNLGEDIVLGSNCYTNELVTLGENGIGKIIGVPESSDGECFGYARYLGDDYKYTVAIDKKTKEFIVPNGKEGDRVCVNYQSFNEAAKEIKVPTNALPSIVRLIGWIDLYTGESKESANKIGKVQIVIPRFQVDGGIELSLTPTGLCNVPISGTALAVEETSDECGESNGCYAYVTEIINDANWYDTLKQIRVAGGDIELEVGDTDYIKVLGIHSEGIDITPIDNKKIHFIPLIEDKVTIDENGTITAISEGSTPIVVSPIGKSSIYTMIDVTVRSAPILVEEMSIDPTYLSLEYGESKQLSVIYSPNDATNKGVKWSSSNSRVATVSSNGLVRYVRDGKCKINATLVEDDAIKAECDVVCVKDVIITNVDLGEDLDLSVGDSYSFEPIVTTKYGDIGPIFGDNEALDSSILVTSVVYHSSDENVATIDQYGNITTKDKGTTIITIVVDEYAIDMCVITVA